DMHGGFVVPLIGLHTRTAGIELAGPERNLGAQDKAALQMAAMSVNLRLRANFTPRRHPPPPPPHPEPQSLPWATPGQSHGEIGEMLASSEKRVNGHIENVKRKYGVTSRIHAVVKGMNARAIHL